MKMRNYLVSAAALGNLLYSGAVYAQDKSGLSQPPEGPATEGTTGNCPNCPPTAPAASAKPVLAKKKGVGSNPLCSTKYPGFKCWNKNEAKASGYEIHPMGDYTLNPEEACPGRLVCAGPRAEAAKKEQPPAPAADEYGAFLMQLLNSGCREEYDTLKGKIEKAKEHLIKVGELESKINQATNTRREVPSLTPLDALQGKGFSSLSPDAIAELISQRSSESTAYEQTRREIEEQVSRLKAEGCGRPAAREMVREVVRNVEKPVKTGGEFVFAPFADYAFSADAENQGRLGVSAGYQTGRWTFGGRAAAILQYTDVDVDTDKSGIQTVTLPGDVQKTTSDITTTTTEMRDFAAVGPTVTYSRGRMDFSAGIDALIGQKAVTKEYTGSMRLTKDGQQLDDKKTIGDSTTESEAWYSAYPHVNLDVRLWKQLYGGLEGGYNTRSDSAQGAFGLKYKL